MAEIKDKVVTVESLSALHEYNKSTYANKIDIISVENGGTGATTSENALINLGLTATADEINHIVGVTSNVQEQLNNKQAAVTGGATTITSNDLTANRVLVSDSSGKVSASNIISTELDHLSGITSDIQAQLDNKAASDHVHDYLSLSGGILTDTLTVNGLILTSEKDYGSALPTAGTVGKIFFKKLSQ